jgi:hypothetical protein
MDSVVESDVDLKNGIEITKNKEKIFILTKIKKHKNWTKEEDRRLIEIANMFKQKSWTKVADYFEDKNAAQCRARYKRIRPGIVKGAWTKDEDDMIVELVSSTGKNWAMISKMMPTRNGKQIRDRFLNYLDPNINKIKFTDEDDKNIIEYYKIYGTKWSKIAKYFEGRTGDMIKNRFYSCLKRKVHVYDISSNKRIRKKYYKTKKTSNNTTKDSSSQSVIDKDKTKKIIETVTKNNNQQELQQNLNNSQLTASNSNEHLNQPNNKLFNGNITNYSTVSEPNLFLLRSLQNINSCINQTQFYPDPRNILLNLDYLKNSYNPIKFTQTDLLYFLTMNSNPPFINPKFQQ